MRLRHKPWAEGLIGEHKDIALDDENLESLPHFNKLEVGSGCGGFILQMALNNPSDSFLGAEIAETAFAIAIKKMVNMENAPTNLKFINTSVDKLIPFIEPESLDAIYLNFSDPWPKKRHHKRRLTFPTRLDAYYKLLKKGGVLYFKTDNVLLYTDSRKYFDTFGKFKTTFIDDYATEAEGDVMSEYEMKFRSKGVTIHRIVAIKE